ncbi:hypothetical protein SESBI_49075 [Sesbania bispinosa]|nr:hypothetical protein SESBI_49075 [Sesbania bispinosa]
MVGSNESVTSDTPELEEASVIYLEEDEEIPIEHGDAYFIDEVGGGVFLLIMIGMMNNMEKMNNKMSLVPKFIVVGIGSLDLRLTMRRILKGWT